MNEEKRLKKENFEIDKSKETEWVLQRDTYIEIEI